MSARFPVSVVIPVRDGLPDVLDAVASALAQSAPPLEVVVVDDGSRDGSGDAIEARFGGAPGPEVRVLRGRFGSAGAARNAGWRAARGDIVLFLGDDILAAPGLVAAHARRHAARPETEVAVVGRVDWAREIRVTPAMLRSRQGRREALTAWHGDPHAAVLARPR